jgi:hypothetical protein
MKLNKKIVAVGATLTVATLGGIAVAYWTGGGSGTGKATAGSGVDPVTLHTTFDGGMLLGDSVTVTVTGDGNGTSDVSLGGKTLKFTVSTDHAGCTAADFTLPDSTATAGVVVHQADTDVTVGTSTLTMVSRDDVNQDACKGATITVDVVTA